MVVDCFVYKSSWVRQIFDENFPNLNKKVGVIDCWNISEYNEHELRKFLEDKDVSFLLIGETLDDKKMVDLCKQYNTYYICFSENDHLEIPPSNAITLPWFFKSPLYVSEKFQPDFDYREKLYDFNMLLGSRRPHRDLMYKSLKHNPKVYSTYFGHPDLVYENVIDDRDIVQTLISQDVSDGKKLNTLINLDRGNSRIGVSHIVPEKIYDVSHFDIISETNYNIRLTTEKTAKPLSTGRFFCYFSSDRIHTYLEKFGFSFSDFPYFGDLEPSDIIRCSQVVNFVDEVSQNPLLVKDIYEKTKENRKHNFYNYHEKVSDFDKTMFRWIRRCLLTL